MRDESVLHALTQKYADLLGELKASEDKAEGLKADIGHLEHVMRLYRDDWTGEGVKPRRPSYPSRYLKVGQGIQTALEVLRDADGPMTVREIVYAIMGKLEIEQSPRAVRSLESSIRFCLERRMGSQVVASKESPRRFSVADS